MLLNNTSQIKSKLYSWGHWFSLTNMVIGLAISTIYWFSEPFPATFIGQVYLAIYSIGHSAFIFFIGYLLLVFPVTLLNKPAIARPWAALISAIGLTLLFIDALVYSAYHYHINLLSIDYIQNDFQLLTSNLPTGFKAALILLFIAMLGIQLVIANALWRNLEKFRRWYINIRLIPIALTCFILGHLGHIWADLTLYTPITKQDSLLPLSHPMTAKTILSQSGLVDLNEYKQKKDLTFDLSNHLLEVPQYQFSCLPPLENLTIQVLSTKAENIEPLATSLLISEPTFASTEHWSPLSSKNALFEIITGMPAIYRQQEDRINSILDTALLTTNISLNLAVTPEKLNNILPKYQSADRISDNRLNIIYHDYSDIKSSLNWLNKTSTDKRIIILLANDGSSYGRILVKGELIQLPKYTTNFDILPTILEGWLTCSFYANYGKFGHNLFSVPHSQSWYVTADENNIYVWYNNTTTLIKGDAQMQSTNQTTGERVDPPNMPILIRAINHLKRYLVDK